MTPGRCPSGREPPSNVEIDGAAQTIGDLMAGALVPRHFRVKL